MSATPLLCALTGYIARKPAIPCLGGAAHAHISGTTCAARGVGERFDGVEQACAHRAIECVNLARRRGEFDAVHR